jgi:NAD(P)-dependent dehydrogenase (short-subunit alcohol dehydrogenase family)
MPFLKDMSVIVTGGASGIGLACAEMLIAQGSKVIIADFKQSAIERACSELSTKASNQKPLGVPCDVRQADNCERLMDTAKSAFGRLDALVHCAGILRLPGSRPLPLHELDEAEYEAVVDTNLKGTFLTNRAALRLMVQQKAGQIVNVSSTSGRKGKPLDSIYCASKAGVIAISESIAEEVRPFGVRVQVVLPDAVDTPLWQQNNIVQTAPPGALPPQRVAELILFCLSLPSDTICENLVIAPFRSRIGKRRPPAKGIETVDAGSPTGYV